MTDNNYILIYKTIFALDSYDRNEFSNKGTHEEMSCFNILLLFYH